MVCVDSLRTCPNLQVSDQSLPPFLCLQGFPLVFREPPLPTDPQQLIVRLWGPLVAASQCCTLAILM